MNFGQALEELTLGKKVARQGWNGKGMFLYMTPSSEVPIENMRSDIIKYYFQSAGKRSVKINAHIDMKAADNTIVIGWLASQTDMLATDWYVVE